MWGDRWTRCTLRSFWVACVPRPETKNMSADSPVSGKDQLRGRIRRTETGLCVLHWTGTDRNSHWGSQWERQTPAGFWRELARFSTQQLFEWHLPPLRFSRDVQLVCSAPGTSSWRLLSLSLSSIWCALTSFWWAPMSFRAQQLLCFAY